nr:MAG TPA: hypothetical protein [Caudoviricetes sp.]
MSQILSFYFVLNTPIYMHLVYFYLSRRLQNSLDTIRAYCSTAISNLLKSIFRLGSVYRSFLSLILILSF